MKNVTNPRAAVLALAVCLVLALNAAPARAGSDAAEALTRAQQLVDGQQGTVAFIMHPTATLKSMACDRTATLDNGDFTLDYTFRFRSWYGTSFYSKMQFHFYANGGLDRCAAGATNAWVRPFTAANFVVGWLKGRLQSNMTSSGARDNDQLGQLLDQGDARTLLDWWLKAAQ